MLSITMYEPETRIYLDPPLKNLRGDTAPGL